MPINQHTVTPKPDSFCVEGRADELFAALDKLAWRTGPAETSEHWLLALRSRKDPNDLAYFICFTPYHVTVAELARVSGAR